jgi:hypothetical protein
MQVAEMGSLVKLRPNLNKPAFETPPQASNASDTFIRPTLFPTNAAVQLVYPLLLQ